MHFQNIIFDLDGTLLDTSPGIIESINYTVETLGLKAISHNTMRKFVGPPIIDSFMKYCNIDEESARRATTVFRNHYKTTTLLNAVPYMGIYDVCKAFKDHGLKMAVATYKPEEYALILLRHYHFDDYCVSMHGADQDNVLKKEDIIRLCETEIWGVSDNTVLVGDTIHDAIGAEKAGISFIAVTYGFGFKTANDLSEVNHVGIANTPFEIADIVL